MIGPNSLHGPNAITTEPNRPAGPAQGGAADLGEPDLVARQEDQHREPEVGPGVDDLVVVGPAEHIPTRFEVMKDTVGGGNASAF